MLNAKEFSRRYAETYGVSYKHAITICNSVFALLGEVLYDDKEDVSIYGFGSFKRKEAAEKKVRHPATGEIITMPAREFIKFTPTLTAFSEKQ